MSEDVEIQDPDVPPGPRIRLRVLLAFMRILAGRRGHSRLVFWGQGFLYTIVVIRRPRDGQRINIDRDPDAVGGDEVERRVIDALK